MTDTLSSSSPETAPRRISLRRAWFVTHQWIGLGLAVIFVVLGITGTALVVERQIDQFVHPKRYAGNAVAAALGPSAYIESARTALAATDRVGGVRYPGHVGDAITVAGTPYSPAPLNMGPPKRAQVFLDPKTAAVLDMTDGTLGYAWVLKATHGHLMLGEVGKQIVGWMGVAMLISCLTGIWIWWPKSGGVLKKLKWSSKGQFNKKLHHHVGIWIAVPLAVLSLTGIYVSFLQAFTGMVDAAAGVAKMETSEARPRPAPPLLNTALTADQALQATLARAPDHEPDTIMLPTESNPHWVVTLTNPDGIAQVYRVHDATGDVSAPPAPSVTDSTTKLMEDVHFGLDLGFVWKAIVFLSGFIIVALGYTGILMWLRGLRMKRLVQEQS
ncbi:MAG: PepSY domain-containing protein [Rhodospirillaceae bacterium]|nr:PepSY domain-containing protein [Rhodospirillaceae bacterium]